MKNQTELLKDRDKILADREKYRKAMWGLELRMRHLQKKIDATFVDEDKLKAELGGKLCTETE